MGSETYHPGKNIGKFMLMLIPTSLSFVIAMLGQGASEMRVARKRLESPVTANPAPRASV